MDSISLNKLNISSQLGNDLVNNFQEQAVQIKNTLKQVGNYDLSVGGSGDTKEYTKLVQQLKDQYASLNSMIKQYSDTFIAKTTQNIEKQKEEIAAKTTSIQAYEKQLATLEKGKNEYLALQAGSTNLTKAEKKLAQTYQSNIPQINAINKQIKATNNTEAINKFTDIIDKNFTGLCMVNLSDFDSLYGHTRDVEGYAKAIEELDVDIPIIINKLDLVSIILKS